MSWREQATLIAPLLRDAGMDDRGGETGVLKRIFSCLPEQAGFVVEFGQRAIGSGTLAKLIEERGWGALYMDINAAQPLLKQSAKNGSLITLAQEVVTAANISSLFRKHCVPENLDCLVIDIDGQDYWVWREIDSIFRPSLVIIEFNAHVPLGIAATIEQDEKWRYKSSRDYGASFTALIQLAQSKGYRLVHLHGPWNLYFVRNDLDFPPELCLVEELAVEQFDLLTDTESFYDEFCGKGKRPSWFTAPSPDVSQTPWQILAPELETSEVNLDGLVLEVQKSTLGWYQQRKTYEEKASLLYTLLERERFTNLVDVGSNIGMVSILARRANPEIKVVAIEADPRLNPVILRNFERHGLDDAIVVNAIAGDGNSSIANFSLNPGNTLDNRVSLASWQQINVPMVRLDNLLSRLNVQGKTFFKVDTQGYELQVLLGLEPWLMSDNNWVLKMEFAPNWLVSQGTDPLALLDFLQLRFDFVEYPERITYGTTCLDALFERPLRYREQREFLAYIISLNKGGHGWVDLLVRPRKE